LQTTLQLGNKVSRAGYDICACKYGLHFKLPSQLREIDLEGNEQMRMQAYLRILSNEATIRALHDEAHIPLASIKQLKARRGNVGDDMWWNWQTQRVSLDIDNPDDGLRTLLLDHKLIFPIIKRHQGPKTDIYLEIVTRYEEGEEPRGLYISAETVSLLSEMGGALDNDVESGH
jgi:hypothetical protein